ncbi:MAG TPA: UbiA family prenyltransferase, partial [Candidatus Elarobacter sp.]
MVLLLDGRRLTASALAAFALVVLAVCAVGNYGYALNDLYDIEEDERAGRANAAVAAGARRMWIVIALSALCAAVAAWIAAGTIGAFVTAAELVLPATYSMPPLRTKERIWLGVASDALAAHVYPAILALLAVSHWSLRPIPALLAWSVVVWSLAAGLRGILSHQLQTAERDARAGLATIVHAVGALPLERFIVLVLLPLEVAGIAGALIICAAGPLLWIGCALYVAYEGYKTLRGPFRIVAFRPQGQRYVPFAEESFYKAWGPIAIALDAARADPWYLLAIPAFAVLFRPNL